MGATASTSGGGGGGGGKRYFRNGDSVGLEGAQSWNDAEKKFFGVEGAAAAASKEILNPPKASTGGG